MGISKKQKTARKRHYTISIYVDIEKTKNSQKMTIHFTFKLDPLWDN